MGYWRSWLDCGLLQSVQALSGNICDEHVNAVKPASVEDCNRYTRMCFITMPQNGKHLLYKLWCYEKKNKLPGSQQHQALATWRKVIAYTVQVKNVITACVLLHALGIKSVRTVSSYGTTTGIIEQPQYFLFLAYSRLWKWNFFSVICTFSLLQGTFLSSFCS
jgi:hypothetical protein